MAKFRLELSDISEIVQSIAEAIKAALDFEVEITDLELVRVGSTEFPNNHVGKKLEYGTTVKKINESGETILVCFDKDSNESCRRCVGRFTCKYQGALITPILRDGKVIGTIALVSLSEEKSQYLENKKESMEDFLSKMGDLLVSKLIQEESLLNEKELSDRLQFIMNSISDSVIVVNQHGRIEHTNELAEAMLSSLSIKWKDKNIKEVFSSINLKPVYEGYALFGITLSHYDKHLIARSIKPIIVDDRVTSIVICLDYYDDFIQMTETLASINNQITFNDIIYQSHIMNSVIKTCKQVANSNSTVLITGESGTGKEMIAQAIHNYSRRKNKPYVAINCGAIPESLIESELFGYEKGAFTGADNKGKIGKFELAHEGTIFLDEISTMSPYLQTRLLRVIQERLIDRIGGSTPRIIDVRIIVATNENLEILIEKNQFRHDLYYRLNVIPINLPPLRERKEDIIGLSYYFINKYNRVLGKSINSMDVEFIEKLKTYDWPGNIRELENVIEYIINVIPVTERKILEKWLPFNILSASERDDIIEDDNANKRSPQPLKRLEYEQKVIIKLLDEYGTTTNAKKRIAKELGMSLSTLYRKISHL